MKKLTPVSKALTVAGWFDKLEPTAIDMKPGQYRIFQEVVHLFSRTTNNTIHSMFLEGKPFKVLYWDSQFSPRKPGDVVLVLSHTDRRTDMRLVRLVGAGWLISIKTLNGKPAGHRLNDTISCFADDLTTRVDASCLPTEWQFERREVNTRQFTEIIPDDYWLFAFFHVMTTELNQYTR